MKTKDTNIRSDQPAPDFLTKVPTPSQVRRLLFYLRREPHRFLTHKEEVMLILAIRNGIDVERCRNEMINRNIGLCKQAAQSVRGREFYYDAVASAMQGLITAIDKFDPSRGFRFSTLAHQWTIQKVNRARVNYERMIRIPEHMIYKANSVRRSADQLGQYDLNEIDHDAISDATGLTKMQIELAVKTINMEPTSYDQPLCKHDAKSSKLIEIIESSDRTEADIMIMEHDKQILDMLSFLNPTTRTMVILHYGLCGTEIHTFTDLARKFDVTRQACEIRIKLALKAIRNKGYTIDQFLP